MSDEQPNVGQAIFALLFLYWTITCLGWFIRNPMAGPGTSLTRFPHVVAFDRLVEYQTPVQTHTSMPEPRPDL